MAIITRASRTARIAKNATVVVTDTVVATIAIKLGAVPLTVDVARAVGTVLLRTLVGTEAMLVVDTTGTEAILVVDTTGTEAILVVDTTGTEVMLVVGTTGTEAMLVVGTATGASLFVMIVTVPKVVVEGVFNLALVVTCGCVVVCRPMKPKVFVSILLAKLPKRFMVGRWATGTFGEENAIAVAGTLVVF
ncbi:hypothetical protein BLS_007937 [Venturia inaequalis]|uniref:Uncharacterized protein n=1 Tax=Venturia inaequalis TaxID=5025 RepID=A0A8H3YLD7_VENIN|nr:hypothetical protein BLS_007937 [Venturia inaequalis]